MNPDVFTPVGPQSLDTSGDLTVLFVGRLEERKGVHYLIDAIPEVFAACPNVRFIILGDDTNNAVGQTSVLAELKMKAGALGVEKHIQWIDRVPLDELPSFYRSADICVVPSVYDNSPYTCLEAMSCGRPVIGTSAGGTREYIVHGESGIIVPPRDANAIACALVLLLSDKEKRAALGQAARLRVLRHFQRKEIARQTVELYERATGTFRGPAAVQAVPQRSVSGYGRRQHISFLLRQDAI